MSEASFEVVSQEIGPCHRCGGEQYLTVSLPHPMLPGRRIVGLCPRCDAGDPAAVDLLAYLAVHGTVQVDDDVLFADLLQAWVSQIRDRVPDPAAQAADEQAWYDGEL